MVYSEPNIPEKPRLTIWLVQPAIVLSLSLSPMLNVVMALLSLANLAMP